MNEKETKLLISVLESCSYLWSNMTCEDISESWIEDWSPLEQIAFMEEFCAWGGDEDMLEDIKTSDDDYSPMEYLQVSTLIDFLVHKLETGNKIP